MAKSTIIPFIEDEEITIEQYNKELDEADAAMDRGEYFTNDEVMTMSRKIIDAKKSSKVKK